MIKKPLLVIFILFASSFFAKNDSLRYKVKFSASINPNFTTISYAQTYSYSTGGPNNSGTECSSALSGLFNAKKNVFPEFDIDVNLFWNFKITLGGFINQFKFGTPQIRSVKYAYHQGSMGGGGGFYSYTPLAGDYYRDNVNMLFFGNFFGLGYCFKKNNIMIDLDGGLRQFWLINGAIERRFNSSSNVDSVYQYNVNLKNGYFKHPFGYYGRMNVSYKISNNLYCRIGVCLMNTIREFKGSSLFNDSGIILRRDDYSIGIQQFSINTGIVFVLL